jgi:hypothetical protein
LALPPDLEALEPNDKRFDAVDVVLEVREAVLVRKGWIALAAPWHVLRAASTS